MRVRGKVTPAECKLNVDSGGKGRVVLGHCSSSNTIFAKHLHENALLRAAQKALCLFCREGCR